VKLLFDGVLLLAVQHDLHHLGSIGGDSGALSDDLGRIDDILQDGLVDGGEGTGSRADLNALTTEVLVHDGSVGNDHDVLLLEFLLQLADQLRDEGFGLLVDHVGDEDDNSVLVGFASSAFNFLGSGEAEIFQVTLELVARSSLDVDDGLGDLLLEFVGRDSLIFHDLGRRNGHLFYFTALMLKKQ